MGSDTAGSQRRLVAGAPQAAKAAFLKEAFSLSLAPLTLTSRGNRTIQSRQFVAGPLTRKVLICLTTQPPSVPNISNHN